MLSSSLQLAFVGYFRYKCSTNPFISLICFQGLTISTYTYNNRQINHVYLALSIQQLVHPHAFQFITKAHMFIIQDTILNFNPILIHMNILFLHMATTSDIQLNVYSDTPKYIVF